MEENETNETQDRSSVVWWYVIVMEETGKVVYSGGDLDTVAEKLVPGMIYGKGISPDTARIAALDNRARIVQEKVDRDYVRRLKGQGKGAR